MALKFDGKYLKGDGKTLCRVEGKYIKEGFSGDTSLCRVEGDIIKEGFSGGRTLIKVSDAARKIGATSLGPTTAAMWFKFCR